jgi:predicted transcriptional regulator
MAKQGGQFTRIPNYILDDNTLDVYEFRILAHITRQTIGYEKKSDGISLSQFVDATGISKKKIIKTIKSLEDKGHIKVTKQTLPGGGNSFSRYSLKVVSERHKGGSPQTQGVVSERHTQHTIEQHMRERILLPDSFFFFALSEHERDRESNRYADHVSGSASKPTAYKVKILKQIRKGHEQTMKAFEEWYLNTSCQELNSKYAGKRFGGYTVEAIYPYTDTTGYLQGGTFQKGFNLYVLLVDDGGEKFIHGAYTASGAEALIGNL